MFFFYTGNHLQYRSLDRLPCHPLLKCERRKEAGKADADVADVEQVCPHFHHADSILLPGVRGGVRSGYRRRGLLPVVTYG